MRRRNERLLYPGELMVLILKARDVCEQCSEGCFPVDGDIDIDHSTLPWVWKRQKLDLNHTLVQPCTQASSTVSSFTQLNGDYFIVLSRARNTEVQEGTCRQPSGQPEYQVSLQLDQGGRRRSKYSWIHEHIRPKRRFVC